MPTSGRFADGVMNEIRIAPFCRVPISFAFGLATLATMSALPHASGPQSFAPTASYMASVKLAGTPAPRSTITVRPALASPLTVSGVAATRVSPLLDSLGTNNVGMLGDPSGRFERRRL
jgi:hypothetical protein